MNDMYLLESTDPFDDWFSQVGIFTSVATAQAYIDSRYPRETSRTLTPWPMPDESIHETSIGETRFFLTPMKVDTLYVSEDE